jgi:hypothetical protein
MGQTGNRKEMDRLQTRGEPILQKIGGQVGYRNEADK